jgi:hypothetical protein
MGRNAAIQRDGRQAGERPLGVRELRHRAIARALVRGGAAAVRRVRYGLYRVASSSRAGRFHTVTVDARGVYRCDCEAGIAGRVCWAQAAVYIAKVQAGGGRVVAPASPVRTVAPVATGATVIDIRRRRAA